MLVDVSGVVHDDLYLLSPEVVFVVTLDRGSFPQVWIHPWLDLRICFEFFLNMPVLLLSFFGQIRFIHFVYFMLLVIF
jgi:hypothetical protein